MYRKCVSAGLLVLGISVPVLAYADPATHASGQGRSSQFMRIYGPALPPFGFVKFCEREPGECRQGPLEEARFDVSTGRLQELDTVNRSVNRSVEPTTDSELYGQTEYWTLPTTKGDCEDYALLKRRLLVARGWPASALLMTVVRDEKGEGHAVLTARTAQGDFILDNKTDEIRPWYATPYVYVMRQSYIDPKVWVSLDSRDGRSPALLSGVRSAR
jgi:predicted transglutaminase-like cysteine proteinase